MASDVEPKSWDELPDLMTIDEFRAFLRVGDRQARRIAKERDLEVRLGNSVRVAKAALARYLRDEIGEDCFEGEILEFPREKAS
jgi:hypothetical protein